MLKNQILLAFVLSITFIFSASAEYGDGDEAYAAGDYQGAIVEWLNVAEQGDARAQYNVAWMYANGRGSVLDFQEASIWYKKSADQGFVHAQYNLANLYLRGNGVTQNDNLAFSWFLKAAEQGDAPAQYNLGRMYILGKGGDKNILEARFWIKLAIENDDEYIRVLAQEVWDEQKLGSY
tara:strand:+ start:104 stop:640 length:537 start_codon:yes stop_codon:yes gene_type:complete